MDIIKTLEDEQLRENKFDFHVGDTVKVDYLIKEGKKISLRCRSRKNFLNQLTKSN